MNCSLLDCNVGCRALPGEADKFGVWTALDLLHMEEVRKDSFEVESLRLIWYAEKTGTRLFRFMKATRGGRFPRSGVLYLERMRC